MPTKHQTGRSGTRKVKPKIKVLVRGGEWVDALQEAVEAHKDLTLLRVRSKRQSLPAYPVKPYIDNRRATPIRRTFTFG